MEKTEKELMKKQRGTFNVTTLKEAKKIISELDNELFEFDFAIQKLANNMVELKAENIEMPFKNMKLKDVDLNDEFDVQIQIKLTRNKDEFIDEGIKLS